MFTKARTVSPAEVNQMLGKSENFILLDVRTPAEYRQVRIDGAKLIPVDQIEIRADNELLDKDIPILVYCQSGMRASKAVKVLTRMGYTNVASFGGIMSWPYETVKG